MTQIEHGEHVAVGASPFEATAGLGVLALDDVSVHYPQAESPSLSGVSLYVQEGEVLALLGANGAGKSTLLRVAAALVEATSGSVRVLGRDIRTMKRRDLARAVALVPQSEQVSVGFRVREVVSMGRAPHQGSWMREGPRDRAAIDEALARCDLRHLADRLVETLSGGEQRRVAIARALAQKPRLLLLDEPGAFLDIRHRLQLYERIAEIARSDRIASVCTMHDLDTAARFASRAVLMRRGRVVAAGPPDEVMTATQLAAALGAEVSVGLDERSGKRYFLPLRASSEDV